MMLTGSSASPFAAVEATIYKTLFSGCSPYAALTGEEPEGRCAARGSSRNGAAAAPSPGPPVQGQTLKAKEEWEKQEPGSCKKTD